MSLSLFALICLIFSIQNSSGQYWAGGWQTGQCYGRFEQYNECASTCPDTCEDIRRPNPMKICNLMCRSGCECIPPFVRANQYNSMSPCVHPFQCRFIY
jgi:hypothetical protein